ncbi:MAG: hypothetical protein MUO54_16995 [Anaerolineales bacterium]|nr:hypothetical protein [Anaerolineales bacterium]
MTKKVNGILIALLLLSACTAENTVATPLPDRESLIPVDQIKITADLDIYPVKSETNEYEDPVPLPYPVNTAGAEDFTFIMPDGNTLYVFFTPDVRIPIKGQIADGVTGIYVFHKINGNWSGGDRVLLQDAGKLALDGCEFVLGNLRWFCTAREGYTGLHWFTADYINEKWVNWEIADFDPEYEVGELHITADGSELYFHSSRSGGEGGLDLWMARMKEGEWQKPINISVVNSPYTDGWPFIYQDGAELWFTRAIGAPELYRSLRIDSEWTEPVKIFSVFSGESSMDMEENIYFTHHYYKDDVMIEADIYLARKK